MQPKENNQKANAKAADMKKYEVTFHHTQYSLGKLVIEAESLAKAEELAWEIEPEEIDDMRTVEGDLSVESVEPVEEGEAQGKENPKNSS